MTPTRAKWTGHNKSLHLVPGRVRCAGDESGMNDIRSASLFFHNGENMKKLFDGKKTAKLGTQANPAIVNVQTEAKAKELESIFKENGWAYTIDLEPDKPEDITNLELLLNPQKTITATPKVGRNAPCPCGSGKKYKKCCAKS